eukprot:10801322-Heterocapsa_arctica.AAC.1
MEEHECLASARLRHSVPDPCSRLLPLGATFTPEPEAFLPHVEIFWCWSHRAAVLARRPSGELRHGAWLI